jgi:hypothetical protein
MSKSIIQNIKDNYEFLEKSIVNQLNLKVDNHYLTAGHNREKIWLDLFRQIIPMKFALRQGVFLIDAKGSVSNEVDIAVFDEQFTPYIFNYGNIQFIPIEAVALVVQCKSKTVNTNDANSWATNIDQLKSTIGGLARMVSFIASESNLPKTQKATKPLQVLCHLKGENVNNENFDLIITVNEDKLILKWNESVSTLEECFLKLNGIKSIEKLDENDVLKKKISELGVTNNPILSLIFQLNQLLMLINNPMLFPHQAYATMFDEAEKE